MASHKYISVPEEEFFLISKMQSVQVRGEPTNRNYISTDLRRAKKIVQCKSNISFLRRCRKSYVVPLGLRIKNSLSNTIPSDAAASLRQRQNRQWLQLALNTEYNRLQKLSMYVFPLNKSDQRHLNIFEKGLVNTKMKKLRQLLLEKHSEMGTDSFDGADGDIHGFVNDTEMEISDKMVNILNKGPSFIPPSISKRALEREITECHADVEICLRKLACLGVPPEIRQECGGSFVRILNSIDTSVVCDKGVSREFQTLRKNLKDNDCVILPTDKTSRLMAIDKRVYDSMLHKSTIGSNNFTSTKNVKPATNQAKFNKAVMEIANKYDKNSLVYKELMRAKCSDPQVNKSYCLPKRATQRAS